jgi:hypothetical protein
LPVASPRLLADPRCAVRVLSPHLPVAIYDNRRLPEPPRPDSRRGETLQHNLVIYPVHLMEPSIEGKEHLLGGTRIARRPRDTEGDPVPPRPT